MPPYKFDTSRAWSRHYGQDFGGGGFPYRFLAVNSTGVVNVSEDGITFTNNVNIPPNGNVWRWPCFAPPLNRVIVVSQQAAPPGTFLMAYTDDGDTWTVINAPSGGTGSPTKVIFTNIFGTNRFYCARRQNGGTRGDLVYSDDGGLTWTPVIWPFVPGAQQDVAYLAVGTSRLVCMGRFLADGNTTNRIFYTDDGVTMVAGATFTNAQFIQTADGLTRACAYDPTTDSFIMIGSTVSNFTQPNFIRTQNGTVINVGPASCSAPDNGDSYDAIRIEDFNTFVSSFTTAIPGNTNPGAWTTNFGVWTSIAANANSLRSQFAYSPGLQRLVVGSVSAGGSFFYSDDGGITWNAGNGTVVGGWRGLVATK